MQSLFLCRHIYAEISQAALSSHIFYGVLHPRAMGKITHACNFSFNHLRFYIYSCKGVILHRYAQNAEVIQNVLHFGELRPNLKKRKGNKVSIYMYMHLYVRIHNATVVYLMFLFPIFWKCAINKVSVLLYKTASVFPCFTFYILYIYIFFLFSVPSRKGRNLKVVLNI